MKRPLPPVTRGTPLRSLIENEFGNEGCETLSELFVRLGYERGMVVHGVDGLDEVSNIGPTKVCEYNNGAVTEYVLTPQDLGLRTARREEIESRSRDESLIDIFRILYGKEVGAKRDIVAANAGASLYTLGKARTLRDVVGLALSLIESGAAARKLEDYFAFYQTSERLAAWKRKSQI